jgi:hypothetical protein
VTKTPPCCGKYCCKVSSSTSTLILQDLHKCNTNVKVSHRAHWRKENWVVRGLLHCFSILFSGVSSMNAVVSSWKENIFLYSTGSKKWRSIQVSKNKLSLPKVVESPGLGSFVLIVSWAWACQEKKKIKRNYSQVVQSASIIIFIRLTLQDACVRDDIQIRK